MGVRDGGARGAALFDEAAAAAVARIRDFGPQHLANTTWAFATLDHAAPALFDAVAAAAVELLRGERGVAEKYRGNNDSFAPQTLSNLVWAFATVGHSAPALFDAVAAAFVQQLGRSNQQHISMTVWAFATAGHAAPTLFMAVARMAAAKLSDFQALANAAWAFAVADENHPHFIAALTEKLAHPSMEVHDHGLVQLQQFSLWCERELRLPEAQLLPPPLRTRCRDALRAVASGRDEQAAKPVARLQQSVGRALGRLRLSTAPEHALAEGYSVDFAFVDEKIAIEVDGPWHYAPSGDGAGRRLVGRTLIKQRQRGARLAAPRRAVLRVGEVTRPGRRDEPSRWRLRVAVRLPARASGMAAGGAAAPPPLKPSVSLNSSRRCPPQSGGDP